MDAETIFNEATEAAKQAVRENAHLENPHAFDCGFAWVVVKPATCEFIRGIRKLSKAQAAKKAEELERAGMPSHFAVARATQEAESAWGHTREYGGGGWQFWMPGREEHNGQSIAIFEAGARAFAEVLLRHGIPAFADSRLD